MINNFSGGGTEWVFNNSGGGNVSALSAGGLSFSTFTGAVGSEAYTQRMLINNLGNVGIGTATVVGGNAVAVYGGNVFIAGNLRVGNTATTIGGIQFSDGTYQTTAAAGTATTMSISSQTASTAYYPTFVSGTGTQALYINTTSLQVIPNSGNITTIGSVLSGNLSITNINVATSTSTGVLTVAGGAGVAGNIYVGGNIYATNTTTTTSAALGAIVATGGIATANNLYVAGSTWAGNLAITNTTASTSNITGAFTVAGGIGVTGNVYAGNVFVNSNVGIGTSSPASALHVVGETYSTTGFATTGDSSYFTPSGLSAIPNYGIGAPGSSFVSLAGYAGLTFYTNQSERMRLTSAGYLGIGTTSPAYTLSVSGSIGATGEITAYASDARLKKNIASITNALDKVMSMRGVTFDWKDTTKYLGFEPEHQHDVGVIAQEVQSVLPEAVRFAPFDVNQDGTSKSGENYLTVQYEKLTALLIEAVKDLNAKVVELQDEIQQLKS